LKPPVAILRNAITKQASHYRHPEADVGPASMVPGSVA